MWLNFQLKMNVKVLGKTVSKMDSLKIFLKTNCGYICFMNLMLRVLKSFVLVFLLFSLGLYGQALPPVVNYAPDEYAAGNQNWMISQGADKKYMWQTILVCFSLMGNIGTYMRYPGRLL